MFLGGREGRRLVVGAEVRVRCRTRSTRRARRPTATHASDQERAKGVGVQPLALTAVEQLVETESSAAAALPGLPTASAFKACSTPPRHVWSAVRSDACCATWACAALRADLAPSSCDVSWFNAVVSFPTCCVTSRRSNCAVARSRDDDPGRGTGGTRACADPRRSGRSPGRRLSADSRDTKPRRRYRRRARASVCVVEAVGAAGRAASAGDVGRAKSTSVTRPYRLRKPAGLRRLPGPPARL